MSDLLPISNPQTCLSVHAFTNICQPVTARRSKQQDSSFPENELKIWPYHWSAIESAAECNAANCNAAAAAMFLVEHTRKHALREAHTLALVGARVVKYGSVNYTDTRIYACIYAVHAELGCCVRIFRQYTRSVHGCRDSSGSF